MSHCRESFVLEPIAAATGPLFKFRRTHRTGSQIGARGPASVTTRLLGLLFHGEPLPVQRKASGIRKS